MSLAYIPPGVTIEELLSPSLAPLLAVPGSVCLVGLSGGVITRTDSIQLLGTTATVLPGVPAGSTLSSNSIVSIIDALNPAIAPTGFQPTTDYTFSSSNYTITRVVTSNTLASTAASGATSITLSTGAVPAAGQIIRLTHTTTTETVAVASVTGQVVTLATALVNGYSAADTVAWGNIPDGDTVYVTYTYTPSDYFQPIRLTSMGDIQQRFGNAWDPTGTTINSPISFAAGMAFQNGASNLVLQPLYNVNSSGVRVQPNATQAASPSAWSTVFTNLLDLDDINIIVPVVGQSQANVTDSVQQQILQAAQDYIYQAKHGSDLFAIAVLGEDSSASSSVAQESALIAHADTIAARYNSDVTEQLVFVNTSQFQCSNATGSLLIGGQYVAAAIAGMLSAQKPSATITRKPIAGVQAVTDFRSKAAKNNDASNGMLVVESKGRVVQIRHGITMDLSSAAKRELNVVRAKHFIIESIRQTLDSQVIGRIPADTAAPTLVNNVVIATLEDLRGLDILSDYTGVQSRIISLDPTAMQVQFSYRPVFIVNYIDVLFALDLSAQNITVLQSTTQ